MEKIHLILIGTSLFIMLFNSKDRNLLIYHGVIAIATRKYKK